MMHVKMLDNYATPVKTGDTIHYHDECFIANAGEEQWDILTTFPAPPTGAEWVEVREPPREKLNHLPILLILLAISIFTWWAVSTGFRI